MSAWMVMYSAHVEYGVRQKFRLYFADYLSYAANWDPNKQIEDIKLLLAQDIDLLLIDPMDSAVVQAGVEQATRAGVPVIKVDEAYSSRECRICHQDGRRPSQGRYVCPSCGEYNADLNGAVNIGSRALAYMAIAGVPGIAPLRGTTSLQVHNDPASCAINTL